MAALELSVALGTFVGENRGVDGLSMRSQNVRCLECLSAHITMKVPLLEVAVAMIDHVALRPKALLADIALVPPDVFVAADVRGQILLVFEALLAHRALLWPIVRVILHVILEVRLLIERFRAVRAAAKGHN